VELDERWFHQRTDGPDADKVLLNYKLILCERWMVVSARVDRPKLLVKCEGGSLEVVHENHLKGESGWLTYSKKFCHLFEYLSELG
jgi:hypothetical protein